MVKVVHKQLSACVMLEHAHRVNESKKAGQMKSGGNSFLRLETGCMETVCM